MPDKEPLVSVIIPIYNAAFFLDQCLDSVQSQTLSNLEIICLNDGSTDNSWQIISEHASHDARIIAIDKPNSGYGASCNRGVKEARGAYIAIVEPDDWIESGMFADMLDFAASFNEAIDIIKTPYWRIWMPGTPQQRKLNCSYHKRIEPAKQPFTIGESAHLLRHHPSIWSALYRREFLLETGILFKEIPGAGWADNPFLMETLCRAKTIIYLDRAYYCYREDLPGSSSTLKAPTLPFDRWNDMADILERLNITDEQILRAHISRGFTYLGGILEEQSANDPLVQRCMKTMFTRMDAGLVLSDPEVSPGMKKLFITTRELPTQKFSKLPYLGSLLKEWSYSVSNNGVQSALIQAATYLRNHRVREGR
ncbi:MAG: glycosyltransferase [Raoultibacter sp.]